MRTIVALVWCWFVHFLVKSKGEELPPFPPLWDAAPDSVEDLPRDGEGTIVLDPWNYLHRLTMYKTLVSVDHCLWSDASFDGNKTKHAGSPVWGLPLQHGWQMFSGRLCIESPPEKNVSSKVPLVPTCWWACANYYFSVFPYLGAVGAGLAPGNIRLLPPPSGTTSNVTFCSSFESCRDEPAVIFWKAFFEDVKSTADECTNTSSASNGDPIMDGLIDAYWKSHTTTIDATTRCDVHLDTLSMSEREFALDWSNIVKFIGPSAYDVNYTETNTMQRLLLPYRMLTDADVIGRVSDFSKSVNEGMMLLERVKELNDASDGRLLDVYVKAMCSSQARASMRDVMNEFASHAFEAIEDFLKIVLDLVFRSPFCK